MTLGVVCALFTARPAEACGPNWYGPLMQENPEGDATVGYRGRGPVPVVHYSYQWRSAARALQELPPAEVFSRVEGRDAIAVERADAARWFDDPESADRYMAFVREPLTIAPPAAAPRAAVLYRQAVGWMRQNDLARARTGFEAVLALPAKQARWRSAWAAYMLANLERDDARAAERYAQVRQLVRRGARDPMGLAFASLRAEGLRRATWDPAGYVRLCHSYERGGGVLECGLAARGVPAAIRAERVTWEVLAMSPERMAEAASDPWLAAAVTAKLAYAYEIQPSNDEWARQDAWLTAIEGADRATARGVAAPMAVLAYRQGDWRRAARWARQGDPLDPRIAEVRAKLARRRGDGRGVIAALEPLPYLAPEHAAWLGEAQLDRGRFVTALQTFLRGGDWLDAAFVAERILTVDELARLMPRLLRVSEEVSYQRRWYYCSPESEATSDASESEATCDAEYRYMLRADLWALLARRLARLGRWDEAARAFSRSADERARKVRFMEDKKSWLAEDAYGYTLRARVVANGAKRAAQAWDARRGARDDRARGLAASAFLDAVLPNRFDLLATEGAPDYAAWGGGGAGPDFAAPDRADLAEWRVASGKATAAERRRLARTAVEGFPKPWVDVGALPPRKTEGVLGSYDEAPDFRERRYHFLWPLAALAWEAAGDLPDADPAKVQTLCRGGHLLKHRDGGTADHFYKRMVWEGRPDPVAVAADRLRWFPDRGGDWTCGSFVRKDRSVPTPAAVSLATVVAPAADAERAADGAAEAEKTRDRALFGISVLLIATSLALLVRRALRALKRRA